MSAPPCAPTCSGCGRAAISRLWHAQSPTITHLFSNTYKKFAPYDYEGEFAAAQKIRALAGRSETQARDVFDLHHLCLVWCRTEAARMDSNEFKAEARENTVAITYDQCRDHVENYLSTASFSTFGGEQGWRTIHDLVVGRLP